jgi:hypothetical protein
MSQRAKTIHYFYARTLCFIAMPLADERGDAEAANGNEQGRSEFETELVQTQAANRKAKLAEQKNERWANRDRGAKDDSWNDSPDISDREPK